MIGEAGGNVGDEADDVLRALLDGEGGVFGAHVGANPAGGGDVDADAARFEGLGKLARGGVEGCFRNAVTGPAVGHVGDGTELAADVDDAGGLSGFEQREQGLGQEDRAEHVGREGVAKFVGLGFEDAAGPRG